MTQILKRIGPLLLILFLASLLRFYKLGTVPHGMAWDEAAIGYNGFAIFTTRRDEWLQRLPVSFRSFGDYKAPLAIYQSGFFTALWGMNLWAVRLPFALYGVLAVLGLYLWLTELFYQEQERQKWALLGAFLLAISPWHIHYSRIAFESGLALALLLWALYFFYRYLRLLKLPNLLLVSLLATLSIYAYHSSKVTVPLLFLFLFWRHQDALKTKIKELIITAILTALLLAPFLQDVLFANGLARAGATIFGHGLSFIEGCQTLFGNLLSYLTPHFLILGANEGIMRHGDGRFGVLEPISLLLILIYLFLRRKSKLFSLALAIIFLGLLPAVISEGHSSSNRSLLALPGFILLIVLAIQAILIKVDLTIKATIIKKILFGLLIAFYLSSLIAYQRNYYTNYAKQSSDAFMDGYLETMSYLRDLDRSKVSQIVFTNDYQQTYIYALFAFEVNPIAYQGGILNLFFFTDKIDAGDLKKENTIVVASKFDQMGDQAPDKIINGSDGAGRFFIYLPL